LFDREADAFFGMSFLEDPVVQRVLHSASPVFFGSILGLMAVVELESAARTEGCETDSTQGCEAYFPGKRNFDPLGLFPKNVVLQQKMLSAEITHGRVAMIAMGIYLLQEYALTTSDTSLFNALVTALEKW
jgi:hypothetical protein